MKRADFSVEKLKVLLGGGAENYERRERLWKAVMGHPEMQKTPAYFSMTREEKLDYNLKMAYLFYKEVLPKLGLDEFNILDLLNMLPCMMGTWPFSAHSAMFVIQLQVLGSKEQADYWVPKAKSLKVIGSYSQTELGHGSDVQGIQTTATYDQNIDQFIIHTPTIKAAKFWPGELGKVGNHAAVIARLIVKGKDYGPQTFIVPIRSMEDHMPLPGVEVGDIGPKHGYQNKDNGYAIFTNVRVPRSALLCKYIRVSREGEVSMHGNPKVAYFTMMLNRILIISEGYSYLARPVTIALRYSAFRSQFKTTEDGQERAVIDYQNQQYRLVPYLAQSFAFFFAARKARNMFFEMQAEVAKGDTSKLGELHRVLSAFKTFITWEVLQGCEESRQACGGHGYLEYAGISQEALDYAARCTYEGDNGVLSQQIGRALVKQL